MIKYRIDHEGEYEDYLAQLAAEPEMDWGPGDPDPPWRPDGDERYVSKMTDWVNYHLNSAPDPEIKYQTITPEDLEWLHNGGPEIEAAERGDIEPLRRKYPHLAKFLQLPKRDHGDRLPSLPWRDNIRGHLAALQVKEIKALWLKHYGKKVRRFTPTAVEIAAERLDVEIKDVERWVKHIAAEK